MRLRIPGLLFVLCFSTAAAGQATGPEPKDKPKPKNSEEEVLTFTTADLERKYGKSKPAKVKTSAAETTGSDPLAQLQASRQAQRDKEQRRAEARQEVTAAEQKVSEIERRLAKLRNPLLGSAKPADDEKGAWEGTDQAERLRLTEESLAVAREELAAARKELAEIH